MVHVQMVMTISKLGHDQIMREACFVVILLIFNNLKAEICA